MTEEKRQETLLGKELAMAGFDPYRVRSFVAFQVEAGAYIGMGVSIGFMLAGMGCPFAFGLAGLLLALPFMLFGVVSFVLCRQMARMVKKGK